jgi:hypothetical protein
MVTATFPTWLTLVCPTSVAVGLGCAAFTAFDVTRGPQHMP